MSGPPDGYAVRALHPLPVNAGEGSKAVKACERCCRVAFATAQEWVSRLEAAQDRNQLEAELRRLER